MDLLGLFSFIKGVSLPCLYEKRSMTYFRSKEGPKTRQVGGAERKYNRDPSQVALIVKQEDNHNCTDYPQGVRLRSLISALQTRGPAARRQTQECLALKASRLDMEIQRAVGHRESALKKVTHEISHALSSRQQFKGT